MTRLARLVAGAALALALTPKLLLSQSISPPVSEPSAYAHAASNQQLNQDVVTQSLPPTPKLDGMGAAATTSSPSLGQIPAPTPTPVATGEAATSANISFVDNLDLVQTTLWNGGVPFGTSSGINLQVSSTLAASKPANQDTNRYQDAEVLLPDGGVLNLTLGWGSVNVGTFNKWSAALGQDASDLMGRTALADRIYLNAKGGDPKAEGGNLATDKRPELYLLNGFNTKLLNRNGDTTTGNSASSYGVGEEAVLGVGFDGGLVGVGKSPFGNYRVEAFLDGSWNDSGTMKALYSATSKVRTTASGVGLNFSLALGNVASINLQLETPELSCKKYVEKVVLVGISFSRGGLGN